MQKKSLNELQQNPLPLTTPVTISLTKTLRLPRTVDVALINDYLITCILKVFSVQLHCAG